MKIGVVWMEWQLASRLRAIGNEEEDPPSALRHKHGSQDALIIVQGRSEYSGKLSTWWAVPFLKV